MSSSIIEIKNINVSYGSNHVLKNVNLNIENKDFYTFLGPSGCGKTTLPVSYTHLTLPTTSAG